MTRFSHHIPSYFLLFFNDTATTAIYTLSLHDALPIYGHRLQIAMMNVSGNDAAATRDLVADQLRLELFPPCDKSHFFGDRKSTRLNSSHQIISYAVFCLKKKCLNKQAGPRQPAERAV